MTNIKLKFKIEILYKIIKQPNFDDLAQTSKFLDSKSKSKQSSAKQSVRNSKVIVNDYESLPGFDREINKLPIEEKDEILTLIKNLDFNTLFNIFSTINNKQFYNKLKTKIGLENVKNTFKEILRTKSEFNSFQEENLNLSEALFINDENELFIYLRSILNISELDAMDIFDIFKFNEFFALTEKSFILLIFLLSSYDCGKLEDFISIFNEDMFITLSGGENLINVSRLKEVGRILGFTEKQLMKTANDIGLDVIEVVDMQKFKEFYFRLSRIHDEQYRSGSNMKTQQSANSPNKGKTKGSGCISKQCNIL